MSVAKTLAGTIDEHLKSDYYAVRTYKTKVGMLVERAGSLRKASLALGIGHSTLTHRTKHPHTVTREHHLAMDYVLHITQHRTPE